MAGQGKCRHVVAKVVIGSALLIARSALGQGSCLPAIKVYAQVGCFSAGCEFNTDLSIQKSALAVRVDPANSGNCPAFCYRITVTNAGNTTLTNLVVTETNLTAPTFNLDLSQCAFPTVLAPGEARTCVISNQTRCINLTNIVTARATGLCASGSSVEVSDQDTNVIRVVPISIACRLLISTDNGASFFEAHQPSCPMTVIPSIYVVRMVVTNTGQFPLQNITVSNSGPTPLCFNSPRNVGNLPVGAFMVLDCTNACTTPGMSTFQISVSGEASQAFGPICAHNSQGELIRTVSTCDACELCVGSGIIQLSRGIPYVASSFPSGTGPQLQTPCGPISSNARWFGLAKDGSYPEGIADLSTYGSSFDTVMFVYQGPLTSPTNLTLLACNDDISAVNQQSRVLFRFPSRAGDSPYWLVVDGKGGNGGPLSLIVGYEPQLQTYKFNSSNQFELRSSVAPALSYQLQSASEFSVTGLQWTPLLTTNLTTNYPYLFFVDTNAFGLQKRFYRVVPNP